MDLQDLRGDLRKLEKLRTRGWVTVRVVVPKGLSVRYGFDRAEWAESIPLQDGILLRPFWFGCELCGRSEPLAEVRGRKFCLSCLEEAARVIRAKEDASGVHDTGKRSGTRRG